MNSPRPSPTPLATISPTKVRSILQFVGASILFAGFVAAVILWQTDQAVSNPAADPATPLATSDSRKQSREIEVYYGKSGVLMERWAERMQNLSHGKPLARLIMVVTTAGALGSFFLASRLPKVTGTLRR